MNAGSGFGVAALVLVILGAIMPLVGLFICWIALGLAAISAFAGSKGWPVAVVAIGAVAFWFLTPSLWVEALAHGTGYGEATGTAPLLRIVSLAMLGAPIVGLLLGGAVSTRREKQ
jgi:uncharacterized membrane protein YkgB